MVKILGQSGRSISDAYDVDGSIVGIEQLEAREVSLVHEMGATIFSERASGAIRRATTGAIAQSVNFDIVLTDLPAGVSRVLGVFVFTDNSGRVNDTMVAVRDDAGGREIPIFAWDANEGNVSIRLVDNGAAVANLFALENSLGIGTRPSMLFGSGQPARVGDIAFRGRTTGFGAGTVIITALIYIGFSQVGGLSSRGLQVPSW